VVVVVDYHDLILKSVVKAFLLFVVVVVAVVHNNWVEAYDYYYNSIVGEGYIHIVDNYWVVKALDHMIAYMEMLVLDHILQMMTCMDPLYNLFNISTSYNT
jgi:putative effector of murein hydrolase LrgA (UPF0299 family)